LGATIVPFPLPETALSFPYVQKVFAAAAADQIAGGELIAWMDPDSLILFPPEEFDLPPGKKIGCSPVHLKNISSGIGEPVNAFWQAIYVSCGAGSERIFPVLTTIDQVEIRAQFNAGLLVVCAQARLLQTWRENFERLFLSPTLATYYAKDGRLCIFVHQAILSATLLARCSSEEFYFFSPCYNVPLFLRERFQFSISNPITCRYDGYSWFANPAWSSGEVEIDNRIKILLGKFKDGSGGRNY
jgi:hypothetical protein